MKGMICLKTIRKSYLVWISIIIIILALFILFLVFEKKLSFIKYMPQTIRQSFEFKIEGNDILLPLHKLSFIDNYDTALKPSLKYYTFLEQDEIEEFYNNKQLILEKKYLLIFCNNDFDLYYADDNLKYIFIPTHFSIENKGLYRMVRFNLIDNELFKQVVSCSK